MTLERAAVESWQDACLGEGEYTYMNVSVHLQLGCGLELRAFGGVAGGVGKYSQKACTLVFPTSLHLQKKKKMQGRKVSSSTSSMALYSPATVCRRHCCRAQSFSYLRNTKLMKSE